MTERELERLLRVWYRRDMGTEEIALERLRAGLRDVVGRRPVHRLLRGRRIMMLVAAAATIAALVGAVGLSVVGSPNHSVVGPDVRPTPTPSASPSRPCPGSIPAPSYSSKLPGAVILSPGDRLQPGTTYTTPAFTPSYTIQSPDCWVFDFGSSGTAETDWDGFGLDGLWRDGMFAILRPNRVQGPGAGSFPLPEDLVGWYRSRSDLALAAPAPVVVGGFDATLLDGTVEPGAPYIGNDIVPIASTRGGGLTGVSTRSHFELVFLQVRGEPVLIVMTGDSQSWGRLKPQLQALLASLTFPATQP
jgi:hypothetical protein